MTIAAAVNEIRDELAKGSPVTILDEIAADYDLNPVLVARKFAETFGTSHTEYQPPVEIDTTGPRVRRARVIFASEFEGGPNIAGSTFKRHGRVLVAIAATSAGIHFLDEAGARKVLRFKTVNAIDAFVTANF